MVAVDWDKVLGADINSLTENDDEAERLVKLLEEVKDHFIFYIFEHDSCSNKRQLHLQRRGQSLRHYLALP